MQGTSGEYFWNCLYFAQPLKRQPLSAGDFFETFLKKWKENAQKKRRTRGAQTRAGDAW